MRRIKIFDTTLRDGEQSPGCSMTIEEKLEIARQLQKLNVDIIEAGFPAASECDFEGVRQITAEIKRPVIAGLARCNAQDIEKCWSAVEAGRRPRIHTFLATSEIHMKYKLRKTRAEVLAGIKEFVKFASDCCPDVEFSPEDATRSEPEFLYKAIETAISAGATTINIPDTVGYSMPSEYGKLITAIRENVPGIENATISVHCHDDLGLATANTIAGIQNGAGQAECTINGIGERAGNAALEEIAMALRTRKDILGAQTGIVSEEICNASMLVSRITGSVVQRNKAIVGENAFAHEAGIHQHGMIANCATYEIMRPETVGATTKLLIGRHSGKHAIAEKLASNGINAGEEKLMEIVRLVKQKTERKKMLLDEELFAIAKMAIGGSGT